MVFFATFVLLAANRYAHRMLYLPYYVTSLDLEPVTRGVEKGMFLYGGSTVILLLEREKANIDQRFFAATDAGNETPVVMGEPLTV